MFGRHLDSFMEEGRPGPHLGFFSTSFPTPSTAINRGSSRLIDPPLDIETAFPISVLYIATLQSQGYWVRQVPRKLFLVMDISRIATRMS